MKAHEIIARAVKLGVKIHDEKTGFTLFGDQVRGVVHELAHAVSLGILPAKAPLEDSVNNLVDLRSKWIGKKQSAIEEAKALAIELVVFVTLNLREQMDQSGDRILEAYNSDKLILDRVYGDFDGFRHEVWNWSCHDEVRMHAQNIVNLLKGAK